MSDIVEKLRSAFLSDENNYGIISDLPDAAADEIERLRAENERLREFFLKALTVVEVVAGEGVVLVYPAYDADDLLMEGCDLLGVEDAEGVRAALGEEKKG